MYFNNEKDKLPTALHTFSGSAKGAPAALAHPQQESGRAQAFQVTSRVLEHMLQYPKCVNAKAGQCTMTD